MRLRPFAVPLSVLLVATLSACGGDGGGGSVDPDPRDAVQSVTVTPATERVPLGGFLQLSATVRDGHGNPVTATPTWASSNTAVATVDASGRVTGVAPGNVTITASASGRSGSASVESFDPLPPTAPSGVSAVAVDDSEIEISWTDRSASETHTLIRREVVGAGGGAPPALVQAGTVPPDVTTFRDRGLSAGTAYRYHVEACNDAGCSGSVPAASVATTFPTLSIDTPDPLPSGQVGLAYGIALQASGPDASWTVVNGTLPAGLALSDGGSLQGTPTEGGPFAFAVQAEGGGQIVTRAYTLVIVTPPLVTTTVLPEGVTGTAYSMPLAAAGGDGTFVWALDAGALPSGLTLGTDGVVSGTPTGTGTATFTVRVESAGLEAFAQLQLTVYAPLVVTTSALPSAVVSTAYSAALGAAGGRTPYTWVQTGGALPGGLTLGADGTVSGTATAVQSVQIEVRVTSADGQTADATVSLSVSDQIVAPSVTTSALPDAGVGAPWTAQLAATDGDGQYQWAVTGGALPPGITLDAGSGALGGTPTGDGTFDVTVQATSAGLTGTADLQVTVHDALAIVTTSLADGITGVGYAGSIAVSGGDGAPAFALASGGLPDGIALDGGTGSLDGTPSASGTANFTVEVTNALGQRAERPLALSVFDPLAVTTASLADGAVGTPYSETVAASGGGGAYAWTVVAGGLPSGLSLNGSTGAITGTPGSAGTTGVTLQVASGDGQTASASLSITIGSGPPTITTTTLPGGTTGIVYDQTLQVTGGDGSYTWTVTTGSLPGGLALGGSDGAISGTPTAAGTFDFTVEVTSGGASDTQDLSITISGAPIVFQRSHLPGGHVGVAYSATPDAATGGGGALTYSITGGALPAGLSLDANTGAITGTPSSAGMAFFEMTATDGSASASVIFGFTISTVGPAGFNIFGVNVADEIPSASIQTAINAAFARYEAAITGDAPDAALPGSGADASCGGQYPLFHGKTVDDVEVVMNIAAIDGPGGIAGQAGVCGYVRSSAPLTITAQLTLDAADVGGLSAPLQFALVFHELGHGLGIGSGVWGALGLMTGAGGATPEYTGTGGVAEFQGALAQIGNPPIENDGGAGTRDSHWDEQFFDTEIMTGWLDGSGNPVSRLTLAAFGDLGWSGIVLGVADAYSVPACSPSCIPPAGAPGAEIRIPLLDDVLHEPLYPLDPPPPGGRD
jgi:hypothetical protein